MWQLYMLASLFANAGENVLDKNVLLSVRSIDPDIASFYRPFLFSVMTAAVGFLGWFGPLGLFFHPAIFLLAPFAALLSILYTYLLRHVEVTSIGTAAYLTPFVFLFIDIGILHVHLSSLQIFGILCLVSGGIAFSIDSKTHRLKPELTRAVWTIFLFNILYGGAELYAFKYLNRAYGVNSPSFFTSLWLLASVCILIFVILRGKSRLLKGRSVRLFLPRTVLSKFFDGMYALLLGQAVILAAVSQVNAFEALFPLVLFAVTGTAQAILKMPLHEKLDRSRFVWKFGAACLLVLGGYLVA